MSYHGEDYIGYKVAAVIIAAVPPIAQIDPNDIGGRALLACLGGLGALLAILGDRPKNWHDAIVRIVGGVTSCFLFGPYVAKRFGFHADLDGIALVFGLIGVLSWYFLGAVSKALAAWQQSGGLTDAIKAWFRAYAGIKLPPQQPPTPPQS